LLILQGERQIEQRLYVEALETIAGATDGCEARMAELKQIIQQMRKQLKDADMGPVAHDPLGKRISRRPAKRIMP